MFRIRFIWAGAPVVGGGLTTLYFAQAAGTAQQAATAAATWLGTIDNNVSSALSWAIERDVATVNEGTGAITGLTTVTAATGTGGNPAEVLPLATQGLVRLRTGTFLHGREVRGRVFIPGFGENNQETGAPNAATVANIDAACTTLITTPSANLQVWSRKNLVAFSVDGMTMWNKWAVLRSRRD